MRHFCFGSLLLLYLVLVSVSTTETNQGIYRSVLKLIEADQCLCFRYVDSQYKHILLHKEEIYGVGPQVLPKLVTALPLHMITTVIYRYMAMAA